MLVLICTMVSSKCMMMMMMSLLFVDNGHWTGWWMLMRKGSMWCVEGCYWWLGIVMRYLMLTEEREHNPGTVKGVFAFVGSVLSRPLSSSHNIHIHIHISCLCFLATYSRRVHATVLLPFKVREPFLCLTVGLVINMFFQNIEMCQIWWKYIRVKI